MATDRVWAILHQRNTSTQSPNYVRVKSARVLDWYTARRVGEPVYGYKTLEFVQGGFGAVDEDYIVDDRGVEGRDEFKEVGLTFEEVGEEIGVVRGQSAELVEERLLRPQLLAERKAWVVVHEYLQGARARRDAQRDQSGRRKFTDGCACKLFC
jgi:hypothetical protein